MGDERWTAMDVVPNARRCLGLSARICDPSRINVVLSSVTESVSFLVLFSLGTMKEKPKTSLSWSVLVANDGNQKRGLVLWTPYVPNLPLDLQLFTLPLDLDPRNQHFLFQENHLFLLGLRQFRFDVILFSWGILRRFVSRFLCSARINDILPDRQMGLINSNYPVIKQEIHSRSNVSDIYQ